MEVFHPETGFPLSIPTVSTDREFGYQGTNSCTHWRYNDILSQFFSPYEPAHEIMVLITQATSEGSGKPSLFAHIKY